MIVNKMKTINPEGRLCESLKLEASCNSALRTFVPMNEISKVSNSGEVDASLRVPLFALFGGAAFWLVVGPVLALIASIKFHAPDFLADCPWLTYGRVQPAADDALLYGFCIPAGLGVLLWLFAHLGQTPLRGAIVPVVAAKLWHLGVLVGVGGHFAR